MPVLPGAEPFAAEGHGDLARVGVVLSHGFTGCPQSMRPWAQFLTAVGLTVRLPRLPGHGTTWQELQSTRWPDWYAEIDRAYLELRERCDAVFAMGLSMGGALALRLAEEHPEVAGLVVVNPAIASQDKRLMLLPVLKWVVPSFPGIGSDIKREGITELAYAKAPLKAVASLVQLQAVVRRDLPRINAPLLVYRSRVDHVVDPLSGRVLVEAFGASNRFTEVVLEDSYHVATLDNDAETIFAGSLDFVRAHASATAS